MKKICSALLCFLAIAGFWLEPAAAKAAMPASNAQQILTAGGALPQDGTFNEDGVSISKTISETALENQFDITLRVSTKTSFHTLENAQQTAVVVVMDQSNTMNDKTADGETRLAAAKKAAKEFLDQFCSQEAGIAGKRFLGFVSFDTNAQTKIPLEEASPEKLAQWKNTIDGIETASLSSHNRFTNIEGGLQLAANLLAQTSATHQYIILLTDGFPTTYIQSNRASSTRIRGYDPYDSAAHVPGEDGYFFDAVENLVCSGTSYSDSAAKKAQIVAAAAKKKGIQIFSVGIDIGGQTIQKYIDTGKQNGISIVERDASGTYAIGDPKNPNSYRNWLGKTIGGGISSAASYCDGDDLAALRRAYAAILAEIREINQSSLSNAWLAIDPMGDFAEFQWFFDQNDTKAKGALSGAHNSGGGNTASFAQNQILWDLKQSGYTKSETEDGVVYTYALTYRIRLCNEAQGFLPLQSCAANGEATLTYVVQQNGSLSAPKTMKFPLPTMEGYWGELAFLKQCSQTGAPLSQAEFLLSHDPNCPICGGKVAIGEKQTISDDSASANVRFSGIPSGHLYRLKETKAPEKYLAKEKEYSVLVSYGETQLQENGKPISAILNAPKETPSPSPSPTPSPTATPTVAPTPSPTAAPTPSPTAAPTPSPHLPQTGQENAPLSLWVAAGACALSGILFFAGKKWRKKNS